MINKIITMDEAVGKIKDGMTVMFGGFLGCGNPHSLVEAILDKGIKDIILIANDTSFPDVGIGKLVVNKRVKKIIVSHIGTNKESGNQMNAGTLEVELVPQGTLAERIRAGGAGLGGVLTPTGVGTVVEKGKQVIELDGKKYILERALRADVALVAGYRVDKKGNVQYTKTTRNFNPLIATAADTVIVEAKEIVEVGEIDPEVVQTPHIFVDYIVRGNK